MQVQVEHTALMEPPWVIWWTDKLRWCIGHLVTPASTTSTTTRSIMDTCSTSRPPLSHRHQQVRQVTLATSRIACCNVCMRGSCGLSECYISGTFLHAEEMLAFSCTWCCCKCCVGRLMHLCIQRARQYALVTSYGVKCKLCHTDVTSQSLL
jgi:hypothetical protein